MRLLIELVRGSVSLSLFAVFAIGSVLLSPFMLVLRRTELCQPMMRAAWRPLVGLFQLTGLIRIRYEDGIEQVRGSVIVANHPSLIDVVMIVARIPKTIPVAKGSLHMNPFVAAIVRSAALPDDATLPSRAAPLLRKGWNVLIFPEGTRTPATGQLGAFHRGAAQLALRSGVKIEALRIDFSRRILGKHQKPWQMTDRTVRIDICRCATLAPARGERSFHAVAREVTQELFGLFLQMRQFKGENFA